MAASHIMERYLHKTSLFGQMIRYFGIAGIGLVFDFGTVIIAKQLLGLHYLIAAAAGFILGLVVTYFLSNAYVFGAPKANRYTLFLTFGLVGLIGLGLLSLLMWLLTDKLGLYYLVSKVLATIVVFGWNFFARRALYKPSADQPAATTASYDS